MQMLASAKDTIERKLAAPSGGRYTSLAKQHGLSAAEQLDQTFYDERLRTDGWHLDEVEDDDDLDFALPPSRARPPEKRCPSICTQTFCVVM